MSNTTKTKRKSYTRKTIAPVKFHAKPDVYKLLAGLSAPARSVLINQSIHHEVKK